MEAEMQRMLVCDDDDAFRKRLARSLRDRGFSVYEAANVTDALEAFIEYKPKQVIVDLRMPEESGLTLVSEITKRDKSCKVVVLTGFGSISTALDAVRRGATNYLTKPATVAHILASFAPDRHESSMEEMPSLAEVEAEYVQRVLDQCGGNVSQSAKILGVHRRSLQRKLRQSSID
jgi:two-component system response regulator RegA